MMHVSWTTLREQIFAKLRRPYRSEANMNEVGHGEMRFMLCIVSIVTIVPTNNVKKIHVKK
jgi:hypothetical protein